nr:hypothetical protein [Tanacetum cinerariifolium]
MDSQNEAEDVKLFTKTESVRDFTIRHGVPSMKRLLKVPMLDPFPRTHWSEGKVWRSETTNYGASPPK